MADVFISYKREDRRAAERLSIALEQLGIDVWWDFELLSGDRYRKVIRAVIDQCSAAIVLWSTLAVDSDFVIDESTHAKSQGKLCPARIDNVDLPFGFGSIHTDDLTDWDGELTHPGFQALVRALEDRIGRKARFGGKSRESESQAGAAELEAFKAAQLANNVSALQSFLRAYPRGAFASFVRGQLETMGASAGPAPTNTASAAASTTTASAAANAPPPQSPYASAPAGGGPGYTAPRAAYGGGQNPYVAAPSPSSSPARNKPASPWPIVAGGLALIAIIAIFWPRGQYDGGSYNPNAAEEPAADAAADYADPLSGVLGGSDAGNADLAGLHPDVRAAAIEARATERRAIAAAQQARLAASHANAAARRARNGDAGFTVIRYDDGDVYEGGYSNGVRNGYALYTYGEAAGVGDTYAGQYVDGVRAGSGVYNYAENTNNEHASLRYEGEYADGEQHGVGVFFWRNGDRFFGGSQVGHSNGPGIYRYTDGRRYEGQYANDRRNGYGVFFDANGIPTEAGIWTNNQLTTPLTR